MTWIAREAMRRQHGRGPRFSEDPRGRLRELLPVLGAGVAALLLGAVATRGSSLTVVLGLMVGVLALACFGAESCICLALLVACGLAPYINPEKLAGGGLPYWLIGFGLAAVLMLGVAGVRAMNGEPAARAQPSAVLWLAGSLLLYTAVILEQSQPLEIKSLAAPFLAFPLAAVVTFVWLLHERAVDNVRRALPMVIAIVAAWAIVYILGSAGGCASCQHWVGTTSARVGLAGGSSRLFTAGQEVFLGFALLAFARALWRPSRWWVALSLLAVVCILLQDSRAQEIAVFGGFLVLLIWRLRSVSGATKVFSVILTGIAVYAVLSSTVGQHIVSGIQGLSNGSGNGAYRLDLLQQIRPHWSLLGTGVSFEDLSFGYNDDLGIPNSLLIIGYVGTALQVVLLVAGALRGFLAQSAIGVAFASVLVMVLLARPSLPFLETGEGAVAYGVVLGAVAALYVGGDARARLGRRGLSLGSVMPVDRSTVGPRAGRR